MKKRLLLTGAGGFLGQNVCRKALDGNWEVFGTFFRNEVRIKGVCFFRTDLRDFQEVRKLFRTAEPDAVIHMAAESRPDICQQFPAESRRINTDASANIAGLCSDYGIPCVFTSTDLVFDGLHPPYQETDPLSPVSIYGEQKAEAEKAMLARYPDTAICRMPLMFGDTRKEEKSFEKQMILSLREQRTVKLFSDEFRTPVDSLSAAEGLIWAIDHVRGIVHLGGRKRVSRYEMGVMIAEIIGADKFLLRAVSQKDIPAVSPRPPDVSLDSSKAFAMGYQPEDMETAFRKILKIL